MNLKKNPSVQGSNSSNSCRSNFVKKKKKNTVAFRYARVLPGSGNTVTRSEFLFSSTFCSMNSDAQRGTLRFRNSFRATWTLGLLWMSMVFFSLRIIAILSSFYETNVTASTMQLAHSTLQCQNIFPAVVVVLSYFPISPRRTCHYVCNIIYRLVNSW